MYLVITNLQADAIYGFEAGYMLEGLGMILSIQFANPQAIDVGNFIVGFGVPTMAGANGVTLLVTMTVMYMDINMGPLNFTLSGSTPSSLDPAYPVIFLENGVLLSMGLSAEFGPAAQINGGCTVVSTDNVNFDHVKSLYR